MRIQIDLERAPDSPAEARRALADVSDHLSPRRLEDARLLVSELVTNSVKYGDEGALRLQIESKGPRKLRVEVIDQGGGFTPETRDRPVSEPGGWGLHLVEALTDRWGVYEGSTHVWFEIDR